MHGITVVVETSGPETYVGRFDRRDEGAAYLKDAGVHRSGEGAEDWADYLERAVKFGIKVEHRQVDVPTGNITRIVPLSEVAGS